MTDLICPHHTTHRAATVRLIDMMVIISSLLLAAAVMPWLETTLNPVVTQWKVTSFWVEGNDVIIGGTMLRHRGECQYNPPPMVRLKSERGPEINVAVESLSPTRSFSFAASKEPQVWGPWRIAGGRGMKMSFYNHYRCHPGWTTTAVLGELDPDDWTAR